MVGKLPPDLWTEMAKAIVYLLNKTPRYSFKWRIPYKALFEKTPIIRHFKVYGYKAFALIIDTQLKRNRLKRMDLKA